MIEVDRLAAQGDVLFRRIQNLPASVREQPAWDRAVVAHSETGHDHVIDGGVRLFERAERDPMICFLSVEGPFVDVVHLRPHDTHQTLRLARGIWEVRRQREWSLEGPRAVCD